MPTEPKPPRVPHPSAAGVKSKKKPRSIYIEDAVWQQLEELAKRHSVSVSALAGLAIKFYVEQAGG